MDGRSKQRRTIGAAVAASGLVVAFAGGLFTPATALLDDTTQTVDDTVDTVNDTVDQVEETVDDTVDSVNDTVDDVEDTVDDVVDDVPIDVPDLPEIPDVEIPDLPDIPDVELPELPDLNAPGSTSYDVKAARDGGASTPDRDGRSGANGWNGADGTRGSAGPAGPVVRSNEVIVDFMERMRATDAAQRDVMAPFPVVSEAEFVDHPGDRSTVELDSEAGGAVVAVADGVVGTVARDGSNASLVLRGADGIDYEYRGLWTASDLPESGDAVVAGSALGRLAGESLEFSAGPGTEEFLSDALGHSAAKAAAYAVKALADSFGQSFDTALAANVVDEVPRPLVALAALSLIAAGGGLAFTAPTVTPAGATTRRRPLVASRS